jgi:hypothetical protein
MPPAEKSPCFLITRGSGSAAAAAAENARTAALRTKNLFFMKNSFLRPLPDL